METANDATKASMAVKINIELSCIDFERISDSYWFGRGNPKCIFIADLNSISDVNSISRI